MTRRKVYDPDVPLFMIASAIANGVKKRGGKLFRISVVRIAEHQYRIKYTCRARDARSTRPDFPGESPLPGQALPDEAEDHA
ncbi:MAG: hypothetical protein CVV32_03285 [Methanomicrobiales archaeon HGW-Methanomicrobiales-3]|jgi:hypothetical protein|nr:MAG: hypothetical protein CVV32_03285 [Methanomicrobiales archaeon HGW-Methanomicrobiales-3]